MNSFKELFESPVGQRGRTGELDAKAHVTPELRAEFKKLVKQLGGKTVARQLLAEMNAGGTIVEDELVESQLGEILMKNAVSMVKDLSKSVKKDEKDSAKKQANTMIELMSDLIKELQKV